MGRRESGEWHAIMENAIMTIPKGRLTIRKGASALANGPSMRLWDIEAPSGSTLAKLEQTYLAALDCIDQLDEHRVAAAGTGHFTDAGAIIVRPRVCAAQ
jgi:hypothetical protein